MDHVHDQIWEEMVFLENIKIFLPGKNPRKFWIIGLILSFGCFPVGCIPIFNWELKNFEALKIFEG